MRIAMITDYYLPTLGGVQTAIKSAEESLIAAGHTVTVFCPLHAPLEDPDVVGLPTSRSFKPDGFPFAWPPKDLIAFLTTELARREVDIVPVHAEMFASLAGIRAAQALDLPVVQTMHGRIDVYTANVLPVPGVTTHLLAHLHHKYLPHTQRPADPTAPYMGTASARRMWRLMINQAGAADLVIVPSAHFATKLVAQGLTAPVAVISNSLEDSVLDAVGPAQVRRQPPGEPLKVMWCGRVSPEKRPHVFVRSIAAAGPGVVADMYGDGVAMAKTRKLVAKLGVEDRVRLRGSVPQADVLAAMREHHVFVSSSYDFDNQPMVILEALATGLPIVLSDPDLAEGLPDGGYLVADSPSYRDLARALTEIAGSGQSHAVDTMSAAVVARNHPVAHRAHAQQLLAAYERVLEATD